MFMKAPLLLVCILINHWCLAQGRAVFPEDPVEEAKKAEWARLMTVARELVRAHDYGAAVAAYDRAHEVGRTLSAFNGQAKYEQAKVLTVMHRDAEALEAYRHVFKWDARDGRVRFSADGMGAPMGYAMLLAKNGRAEEARAMYYVGMRNFNIGDVRESREPIPYLAVFEPDTEGVASEYTPARLEAAALLALAANGGWSELPLLTMTIEPDELLKRAHELWPEWFGPVLWQAALAWNRPEGPRLLDQAERLARPGPEKELVAQYRVSLAEHIALNEARGTPGEPDTRPMKEGNRRRARMECLRPREEILKRLVLPE